LKELALERGRRAHLIDKADDIRPAWFEGHERVLITAGASAPESIVRQCVDYLRARYGATVEERSLRDEEVHFPLPRLLRELPSTAAAGMTNVEARMTKE
jgi:4-hydroxy-3-methylbut-2-enyl diphosphate reductase